MLVSVTLGVRHLIVWVIHLGTFIYEEEVCGHCGSGIEMAQNHV
jgi:hypothetical protein